VLKCSYIQLISQHIEVYSKEVETIGFPDKEFFETYHQSSCICVLLVFIFFIGTDPPATLSHFLIQIRSLADVVRVVTVTSCFKYIAIIMHCQQLTWLLLDQHENQ